jgi:hypothetical protein
MAKSPRTKTSSARSRRKKVVPPPRLPDPKIAQGPRRPFRDPGLSEAWWWLGIPVVVAIFVVASYRMTPEWHRVWVVSEGIGFLEMTQFIAMVIGFAIAVKLLLDPFVRRRPLVLAVTVVAALSCFYIAGEEMSWGQHIFLWETPELITEENKSGEFSIHNMYGVFDRIPRALLEIAVLIGGLIVPLWCAIAPRWRVSRLALFLPAAVLVPTALGAFLFKLADILGQLQAEAAVSARTSEAVEFYLYFFILAYLIVFQRRINALQTEEAGTRS